VQEVVQLVVLGEGGGEFLPDPVDALGVGHAHPHPEVAVYLGADPVQEDVEFPLAIVPAVDAGVLAGDADLRCASVDQRAGLLDVLLDRRRVYLPGRVFGDTVRTVGHTAASDREDADDVVQDGFGVGGDGRALAVADVLGDRVPVEDFGVEAGLAELLALGQRHTARDHEVGGRLGVEFLGPPEHVSLGLLDHGTGVEDRHVGLLGAVGGVVAAVPQGPLYLSALTSVRRTAVGLDVVAGHLFEGTPARSKTRCFTDRGRNRQNSADVF